MSDDYLNEDLSYTRNIRKRVVESLLADKLPESDEDRKFLISMIDGIDRSALAKSKIKIEDKNANSQERVSTLVADVLNKINNRDLKISTSDPRSGDRLLVLEYSVDVDTVDGEMETGVKNLDYDELMKNI